MNFGTLSEHALGRIYEIVQICPGFCEYGIDKPAEARLAIAGREDDDRDRFVYTISQLGKQLETRPVRQPEIENDQVERLGGEAARALCKLVAGRTIARPANALSVTLRMSRSSSTCSMQRDVVLIGLG